MTKRKSFKRRVRARMEKTNESYAAARRQLIARSERTRSSLTSADEPTPISADSPDPGHGNSDAGVRPIRTSPDSIRTKTGRDLDDWFALLDEWDATTRKHPEIARWLASEHGVPGWWAQTITVAYEQARGMRLPGQHDDGQFSVSASKTVNIPVETLFDAVAKASTRAIWLPDSRLEVTTATPPKYLHGKWGDDQRISIGFNAKGEGRSQVAVQHDRLPDAESARRAKAYWAQGITELKKLLES